MPAEGVPAAASASARQGAAKRRANTLRGIAWMLLTGVLFVCVTGIVRHLGSDMSPVQAAFIRYAFGLAFFAPMLLRMSFARIVSARYRLHLARGLVHGIGVMLWFYAMAHIPIAEVTALGFIAPIFTTIGAAMFLGERLHFRRIAAVIAGFVGAIVILRPGLIQIDPGAIAMLIATPLFAASFLLAKKLTETESSVSIVAFMSVVVTVVLAGPAIAVWRAPTWEELGWLALTAAFATSGHYTLTRAFRLAEITVTQPISFLQLLWATLLGLYVFGETPDLWTWVGGAIIVGSATYIAHRESVARQRADT